MAAAFGPYSPIRQAGDYYFVSGQVGVTPERTAREDVTRQSQQALQNLESVLQSAGLAMADVVKTTIFLKNIADFAAVNEVYITHFPEPRPARSCVEVAGLPKLTDNALLVEIEAVAYKEQA